MLLCNAQLIFSSPAFEPQSSTNAASDLVQALLKKTGKASVLGSLEENDPDAADDDEDEDEDGDHAANGAQEDATTSSVVDKITDLLGKTGLTST